MMDDTRFDSRTIDRNLANGTVSHEEYAEYLAQLADATDGAENVAASMIEHEQSEPILPLPTKKAAATKKK